jgi:hypothetical protein
MALFKILRGSKESLQTVPIKDGYAYFTPEDGKFYIDVSKTDGILPNFGVSQDKGANRICINEGLLTDDSYLIFDCGTAYDNDEESLD